MIEKNMLTLAIFEALEKSEGCPLCYLWVKDEQKHLEHLLSNEVVMDPGFREKVRFAKGFCNYHMHLLYKKAHTPGVEDGLGYALYMRDVVECILDALQPSLETVGHQKLRTNILVRGRKKRQTVLRFCRAVKDAIEGRGTCPACQQLELMDQIHLHTMLNMLDDGEFRKSNSLKALCLPHMSHAVDMTPCGKFKNPTEIVRALAQIELEGLQQTRNCLSEFIRKQDYSTRNEPRGIEVNAKMMALNILAGTQRLLVSKTTTPTENRKQYLESSIM